MLNTLFIKLLFQASFSNKSTYFEVSSYWFCFVQMIAVVLKQTDVTFQLKTVSYILLSVQSLLFFFFFQYVSLSKRYIPEVINFLHGILFLAARKETGKGNAETILLM